jgi:hypothetical protein
MEKTIKVAESSMLYRKIDELGLSALDRAEAVAALEASDRFADGIFWLFEKIERIAVWLVPKPTFKPQ